MLVLAVSWIFVRSTPFAVDKTFRMLQLGSAALYSLGHYWVDYGGTFEQLLSATARLQIVKISLFVFAHLAVFAALLPLLQ